MTTLDHLTTEALQECLVTARQRARRDLNNFRSFVRRTGLTGWVRDRSAAPQYREAFRSVVAVEDAEGVDSAADLGDRLDALRREATAAGLLSPTEILEAEREALAEGATR